MPRCLSQLHGHRQKKVLRGTYGSSLRVQAIEAKGLKNMAKGLERECSS